MSGWAHGFGTPPDQEHVEWCMLASAWRQDKLSANDVSMYEFQMIRAFLAAAEQYEDENDDKIKAARDGKDKYGYDDSANRVLKSTQTKEDVVIATSNIDMENW